MAKDTDKPTIARIRDRLDAYSREDLTIDEARIVFNTKTKAPIQSRIDDGTFTAVKVLGIWQIDVKSIHRYLDLINNRI